jgi:hypothetical protein
MPAQRAVGLACDHRIILLVADSPNLKFNYFDRERGALLADANYSRLIGPVARFHHRADFAIITPAE